MRKTVTYNEKNANKIFIILYTILILIWLFIITKNYSFDSYIKYYPVPITMVFGSFIAGFTCEGGGAVAFPLFTKVLKIAPHIARDFSFLIQSIGMTFASITILLKRIKVNFNVVKYATLGGIIGIVFGSMCIDRIVTSTHVRLLFTFVLTSFGIMIYMKNFKFKFIQIEEIKFLTEKQKLILVFVGIVGGIFSSLIGTGGDFITFSCVVLYFKLSEKVATPTSVIIMSLESIFGSFFRLLFIHDLSEQAIEFWALCIPIVALLAPLGALLCSKVSRMFIVKILLMLITIEFVTSLYIFNFKFSIIVASIIILGGQLLFYHKLSLKYLS